MLHRILRYLDIPFIYIFLMVLVILTAWAGLFYLHFFPRLITVPLGILSAYVSVLTLYWIILFIRTRQFQDELEVWETIQKKSMSLALSMELNCCFSGYYIYEAVRYHSSWFTFVAIFYISLTIARFVLLREFIFTNNSLVEQYKRYIAAGYFMVIMMVCLGIMTMIAVNENYIVHYPGKSLIISTAFSLYLIISAVRGYLRYRKYKNPLLSGNQLISISAALLGILSLQTAYLPKLLESYIMIHNANLLTGIIIFTIMICMSLYMIIHGGREMTFGLDENGNRIDRKKTPGKSREQ